MRIGAFCFAGTGHTNPMAALARRLMRRGHQVVIFGIADIEPAVRAAGVEFVRIGEQDFPPGTLRRLDDQLARLKGLAMVRLTMERVKNTARTVLRDGPEAVRKAGIEAMLVDEADVAGNVADYLGLPFVSVAMFPPLGLDNRIPPFCFDWPAGTGWFTRLRNEMGFRVLSLFAAPMRNLLNGQRKAWGLKPILRASDALSTLAQVAQLPEALEFDLPGKPAILHYTGPFVDPSLRAATHFPWEKLDGRPLVYASLGTLQNGAEEVFRTIAEACDGLGPQLVISLGGGLDPQSLGALTGNPLVVRYAPQLEIVKRAALVITHAGLNTVLESLAEGVPLVAIPLGNDQPGVAARVAARGAGLVIPRPKLTAKRLRRAVERVLREDGFRQAALRLRDAMVQVDGLDVAADVIERAFGLAVAVSPNEAPIADSCLMPNP